MKTRSVARKAFMMMAGGVVLASLIFLLSSCVAEMQADAVEQAYELRMMGNADSAQAILEQVLAADSTHAAAWFELARTKQHIGLGNPRLLMERLGSLQQAAENATANDPANVTYAYYKGYVSFFRAYASFMRGQPDAAERVAEVIAAYEAVLKLDPDFHEARLYLVEILCAPGEMGGDVAKAEVHVKQLEERDPVSGAKARELILAEDVDRVQFWKTRLEENPGSADLMEQLGRAYLYQEKMEEGMQQLEAALQTDPTKQLLLLDMARYHVMVFRQDASQSKTALPMAKEAISRYLKTEPIRPLRAYALHTLARIEGSLGSREAAATLFDEAQEQDPHVSKAFAVPSDILFTKLDEVTHFHRFFSRPF
ncbi:MAG: hypothetical protein KAY32_02720 [Candidatus Eisenbacteria sp.]|nr:hypothetical protein [Candidatus Eisenbacteria bacterium]